MHSLPVVATGSQDGNMECIPENTCTRTDNTLLTFVAVYEIIDILLTISIQDR